MENRIIQLTNIVEEKNFSNPQIGRVYDASGLCPCLSTMQGGDRQPMFVVKSSWKSKRTWSTKLVQVGQYVDREEETETEWMNPQRGRVYSARGCSPTITASDAPQMLLTTEAIYSILHANQVSFRDGKKL